MAFKVRMFGETPDFESLHAAKLTNFPLEKRDYKPFSQARICFSHQGLHVQFHSFEAVSLPDSRMDAVLCLTKDHAPVRLTLFADGRYQLVQCIPDGSERELEDGILQPFTGEDLQGVYWGGTFTLPQKLLTDCFGEFAPVRDFSFEGNFYKRCEDTRKPHYGSFYPADFSKSLTDPENLGSFVVIDY